MEVHGGAGRFLGKMVVDAVGNAVGAVSEVYVSEDTAVWASIPSSTEGAERTLLPAAALEHEGEALRVPFEREAIDAAPTFRVGHLPDDDEEYRLLGYFRAAVPPGPSPGTVPPWWRTPEASGELRVIVAPSGPGGVARRLVE